MGFVILCALVTVVVVADRAGHAFVEPEPPRATAPRAPPQPASREPKNGDHRYGEIDEPCTSLLNTSSPCHAP
jgi:hypothetical protein